MVFNPFMFNSADNQSFHFALSKTQLSSTDIQSPNSSQVLAYAIVQKNLSGAGTPTDYRVATVLSSAVSVQVGENVAPGQLLYLQTYSGGSDFARCTVCMHWGATADHVGGPSLASVPAVPPAPLDRGGASGVLAKPQDPNYLKLVQQKNDPAGRKRLKQIGISGLKAFSCCERSQASAINNIFRIYDDFTDALLNPVANQDVGLSFSAPLALGGGTATLVRFAPGATVGLPIGAAVGTALAEVALPLAGFAQISRWSSQYAVFEAVGALGVGMQKITECGVLNDCGECIRNNAWGQKKRRQSALWKGKPDVRRIPLRLSKHQKSASDLIDIAVKPVVKPIIKKIKKVIP